MSQKKIINPLYKEISYKYGWAYRIHRGGAFTWSKPFSFSRISEEEAFKYLNTGFRICLKRK